MPAAARTPRLASALRAAALLLLLGAGLVLLRPAHAQGAPAGGRTPAPQYRIENPDRHCVAAPEVMRRQHPAMLRHQRDLTVRKGVRGMPVQLRACIECHASRDTGSVLGGSGNFCQGCHEYTGIRLDCFECHTPSSAAKTAELPAVVQSTKAGS